MAARGAAGVTLHLQGGAAGGAESRWDWVRKDSFPIVMGAEGGVDSMWVLAPGHWRVTEVEGKGAVKTIPGFGSQPAH